LSSETKGKFKIQTLG